MTKHLPSLNVDPTFLRGRIHWTEDNKYHTASQNIKRFVPKEVTIPLVQHLGGPAEATVQRKTKVTRGDLIGKATAGGTPVHASVTGIVKRVALAPHPTLVEIPAIVIETDAEATEPAWEEVLNWFDQGKEKMLGQIAEAGIVGLGGATFPTHRKLRIPEGIAIDTLILNGAECEPFLTSDYRLMLESPEEIIWGSLLLAKILGTKNILIGIEDNKKDAAAILQKTIDSLKMQAVPRIVLCKTQYPQGSERQLIESLTGRVVPPRKLPMHVGIMVQNIATAAACYQAIRYRKPLLDRIITVSGSGILAPRNLSVPIGTLVQDIVTYCGGMHPHTAKIIAGGPMMGRTLGRLDVPVIKGTGGLIFLRREEIDSEIYGPCISCGRCLEVCPLGLEPNQISIYTEAGHALETEEFGTKDCFECGCCSYVCPAKRPLVQFIQIAKHSFQSGSPKGLAVDAGVNHD